ncbi:MAG: metallophosphoesterase [Gammaproteobacteria bacterium]|nr:metallophosphoesterase [Gammaproteobacteria bacterium]
MERKRELRVVLRWQNLFALLTTLFLSQIVFADDDEDRNGRKLSIIHLSDVHCHMIPHDENFIRSGNRSNSGGLAKLATGIKNIREDAGPGKSLLFMVGDATHGSGECTFSMGNAIMPIFNSFGIDGFVMGNWDFAFGKNATRNRFANGNETMSPNNQTTLSNTVPGCTGKAPNTVCDVVRATFDTVANNVYSFGEKKQGAARKINLDPSNRVFRPYVIREANGVKVAYIGITTTRLPVQNPLFNLSFRFTKGHDELPRDIAAAKAEGAELIVLATELGLGDNVQIAKEVDGIDIILSGDTHEAMPDPMIVTRANGEKTYIVESGEDAYLGRLDIEVSRSGRVIDFEYDLLEMTDEVPEDTSDYFVPGGIKNLVAQQRLRYVDADANGMLKECLMYGPGGFPYGKGHKLCTSLDTVVGYTEVELERRDVIGDVVNNFIGDAALFAGKTYAGLTDDNSFGITNGFRYDIPLFAMGTPLDGPDGGYDDGAITIGDLYQYLPIVPAASIMEYTGGLLRGRYEAFLEGVFDPHPFRHQGGWWMGFSRNMNFVLDLESAPNSVPLSTLGGRILEMKVGANSIDAGKTYYVISCYPHGEGTDRQCRTSGGRNLQFFCGTFEPDMNTPSTVGLCPPLNTQNIVDPTRKPVVLQVAPDNYFAPAQMIREYFKNLPDHTIKAADYAVPVSPTRDARRNLTETVPYTGCELGLQPELDKNCDGVPDSKYDEVQPAFGAGPSWLGRGDFGATVKRMKWH